MTHILSIDTGVIHASLTVLILASRRQLNSLSCQGQSETFVRDRFGLKRSASCD